MNRTLRFAAVAAATVTLSGCISLFPKSAPSQLYRFEARPGAAAVVEMETAADGRPAAPKVNLILPPPTLPREASGDQLLAVTGGNETQYIAGSRWIAPAQVLFEESTRRAFAGRADRARLMTRGELGAAEGFLRLDVTEFETRYAAPGASPTVHVVMRALLTHKNGAYAADRTFAAEAPAGDNRVSAIVPAYSAALEKVTGELVSWTDRNAATAAADPPAPPLPPAASVRTDIRSRSTSGPAGSSNSTTSTTSVRRPNTP